MAEDSDAPKLQTDRLILRAWRDDDIAPWAEMSADPRVMEFFPSILARADAEKTAVRMRELLERDGFGWWALEVKGGAPFIGVIALQMVPFEVPFTPAMEVGWRLAFEHWDNGYATEGAQAALRFGFEVLDQEQIVAMTAAINLQSQHVMERLGMTRDPIDDFDHPRLPDGHPLRRHVLYRLKRVSAAE
jgi:RimJ/RimL family protein N-acetyltransferase